MFDKLKELVWEEDDNKKKPPATAPKSPTVTAPAPAPAKPAPVYVAPGSVDPDIKAKLMQAIGPAAAPALSALQKSLAKLATAIPDPNARLTAAIALLESGNDLAQVRTDIREALEALAAQESRLQGLAESARKQQIGAIEEQITSQEARLRAIAKEQADLDASLSNLRAQHSTEGARIQATLDSITATAASIRQELETLAASIGQKGQ